MPNLIKVLPPDMPGYELSAEMVNRMVKACLAHNYSGVFRYNRDEETAELLEYLACDLEFLSISTSAKVLAFDNGLFRDVAIVRTPEGDLRFSPATQGESGEWAVHEDYSSDYSEDVGFEEVEDALAHAEKMGWKVAVVQD